MPEEPEEEAQVAHAIGVAGCIVEGGRGAVMVVLQGRRYLIDAATAVHVGHSISAAGTSATHVAAFRLYLERIGRTKNEIEQIVDGMLQQAGGA